MLKHQHANVATLNGRHQASFSSFSLVEPLLTRFLSDMPLAFIVGVEKDGEYEFSSTRIGKGQQTSSSASTSDIKLFSVTEKTDQGAEFDLHDYLNQSDPGQHFHVYYFLQDTPWERKVVALAMPPVAYDQLKHLALSTNSFLYTLCKVVLQHCAVSRRDDSIVTLTPELVARAAGQHFLDSLLEEATGMSHAGLYHACCQIASAQYEGRSHHASIVFGSASAHKDYMTVVFEQPMHIAQITGSRKLVEMATNGISILCDGEYFIGFMREKSPTASLSIGFLGRGLWGVYSKGELLLLVDNGNPVEPARMLELRDFAKHLKTIFNGISEASIQRIWQVAIAAAEQPVGTNILFTDQAQQEAKRLASQCIPVTPVALTTETTRSLTGIDGTLIADLNGHAHALGAIMDGDSTPHGTWQRGGRYNSAANYVTSASHPALILIVSQDGYIDVVPPLPSSTGTWTMRRYLRLNSTATSSES